MKLALAVVFALVGVAQAAPDQKTDAKRIDAKKAAAKAPDAPPPDPSAAGSDAAAPDAGPQLHAIHGPKLVDLGNSSEIDLPAGMIMLEKDEAQAMVRKGGGSGQSVVAAIGAPDKDWLVIIEYDDVGYVKDSDANELDAKELLDTYRDGTNEQNKERKSRGIPELTVDTWTDMPHYEKAVHHLVWGLKGHDTGGGNFVNFFTRILGRRGFLSVNLIDAPDKIEQSKSEALSILTATRFKQGARYEDYREGDRSSGIGLKGLVIGGAGIAIASKTGLLLKLLLVFKKGFIVLAAAIGGFFKWLFGRKKTVTPDAPPPPTSDPSGPPPSV